nr:hypothetical protein [Tanacetum cinerariifolium]
MGRARCSYFTTVGTIAFEKWQPVLPEYSVMASIVRNTSEAEVVAVLCSCKWQLRGGGGVGGGGGGFCGGGARGGDRSAFGARQIPGYIPGRHVTREKYNVAKTLSDVNFLWKKERVCLLVGSSRASTTPIYSPVSSSTSIYSTGSSSTPIYSPGSSTSPRYSPRALTPQSYSPKTSKNAECSNCKHLLDKIMVLEATVDMYVYPKQHIVNFAALIHEVYNNMRKLDYE